VQVLSSDMARCTMPVPASSLYSPHLYLGPPAPALSSRARNLSPPGPGQSPRQSRARSGWGEVQSLYDRRRPDPRGQFDRVEEEVEQEEEGRDGLEFLKYENVYCPFRGQ
jgi:hypothetical protein